MAPRYTREPYHLAMSRFLCAVTLLLALAAPAAANEYTAERFDSRIEVLRGGSLRVTESIVFRFEEGTFTKVFRVIPTRRTDGIEFVSASMDGTDFPVGTGRGNVSVRRNEGLRIEWQFAPTSGRAHTFVLTYVARGVVRADERADIVAWRALPNEHGYRIESTTIDVALPSEAIAAPAVEMRRVGNWQVQQRANGVTFSARDIGRNGWLEFSLPLARGTVLAAPPEWQERRRVHDSYRNPALLAAGAVLIAGIVLLFGIRQSYDAPPPDISAPTAFSGPPDPLPPALAGAVASNGNPNSVHAFAALFALAQRGVLTVHEDRGMLGTRAFRLTRNRVAGPLAPHERLVLDTVFAGKADAEGDVTLSKAHSRITRRLSKFREAVVAELADAGLLDPGRQQVRKIFNKAGLALLLLAAVSIVPVAFVLQRYGPWLFLIPASIFIAALASFITGSAHTPLSNEGVRRSAAWRAYRKFLRETPRGGRHHNEMHSPTVLLPYAVALGLGMVWSKLFKNRIAELPPWFRAASAADAHRAFVAFVGVGGAAHGHSGGAGGGGGAAGGGASGAG